MTRGDYFYFLSYYLVTYKDKQNKCSGHTHTHTYACINLGPLGTGVIRCKRNLLGKRAVTAKEERSGEGGRGFRLECRSDSLEGAVKEGVKRNPSQQRSSKKCSVRLL